jgi:ribonuclease T1
MGLQMGLQMDLQMGLRSVQRWGMSIAAIALLTSGSLTLWSHPADARTNTGPETRKSFTGPTIALEKLPPEAKTTLKLIQKGGPFPYPQKDGTVFGNFERRLPIAARGYYREYTVPTPGARNRGARRIIAGQQREYYYTGDHYGTFARIQLSQTIKLKSLVP